MILLTSRSWRSACLRFCNRQARRRRDRHQHVTEKILGFPLPIREVRFGRLQRGIVERYSKGGDLRDVDRMLCVPSGSPRTAVIRWWNTPVSTMPTTSFSPKRACAACRRGFSVRRDRPAPLLNLDPAQVRQRELMRAHNVLF